MNPSRALLAVATTLGLALLGSSPAVARTDEPTLTLSRATELGDTETIEVSGTGFEPNQSGLTVFQCPAVDATLEQCQVQLGGQFVTADADGRFGPVSLTVLATFGTVNCRIVSCVVRVKGPRPADLVGAPIAFSAEVPLEPSPTAAITTPAPPAPTAAEHLPPAKPDATLVFVTAGSALGVVLALAAFLALRRRRA